MSATNVKESQAQLDLSDGLADDDALFGIGYLL